MAFCLEVYNYWSQCKHGILELSAVLMKENQEISDHPFWDHGFVHVFLLKYLSVYVFPKIKRY